MITGKWNTVFLEITTGKLDKLKPAVKAPLKNSNVEEDEKEDEKDDELLAMEQRIGAL